MFRLFNTARDHPQRLTDSHPAIDCFDLAREARDRGCQLANREAGFLIGDTLVALKPHPFNGWNFVCPRCSKGAYRLHFVDGCWACRTCHRLDYPCRHRCRTVPGLHRLMRLRRKIGAGSPFTKIALKDRRARQYQRIVAEIRQLEAALLRHMRTVNDALDR